MATSPTKYVQKKLGRIRLKLIRALTGKARDIALEEQLRLAGKDAKIIVEVGASDGRDCEVYAAKCERAHIYAYEPLPENFTKLEVRAHSQSRIHAINAAVSSKSGNTNFHITKLADASSLKTPKKNTGDYNQYLQETGLIPVRVVTLDEEMDRLNIQKIDLLKMDAQGSECDILQGFSQFLKRKAVAVIYTEVIFTPLYDSAPLYHDIATYLESLGYRLHSLYNYVTDNSGRLAWADAIFVPESEDVNLQLGSVEK
jgi:FkbM family methyltransferase